MSDAPRPRDFVTRSDRRGCLAIARDWGAVVVLGTLGVLTEPLWIDVLVVLAIGRVQFAIGEALVHEASHHNLFATRRLNDDLQVLYALPFFVTLSAWRREHLAHHRQLGGPGDHIVDDYRTYGLQDAEPNLPWIWFGRPALGLVARDHVRGLFAINGPRDWGVVVLYWTLVLGVFVALGQPWVPLLYWILPLLLVFAPLLYWSEIADHFRTRTGTRTRTSRLANWLGHDNGFHQAHHRWPSIPSFRLREAHDALIGEHDDVVGGARELWRDLTRPREPVPAQWTAFWPCSDGVGASKSTSTQRRLVPAQERP